MMDVFYQYWKRCGTGVRFAPLFLWMVACLVFVHPLSGNAEEDYLRYLIEAARKAELHNDRYWWTLLHYRRGLIGVRSLVDDQDFFLSPRGKTDPQAELEAAIAALFRDSNSDTADAVCRFVARFAWLKERLLIDPARLPVSGCKAFDQVVASVRPKSATVIFPTYHMNSPASMFGHTLITIDTENRNKLLSHAINYAAVTDETNGLFFAVKGLFGMYKGYYSILPYYQKIQQYSDISQRDIWEYQLNLTESEVQRLMMHLWELRDIHSRYYFFDENCSYNLLFLLEAARPSLHLTDRFPLWALPVDTIKVMNEEGVIAHVEYRPSKATKIKQQLSLLTEQEQTLALSVADGKTNPEELLSLDDEQHKKTAIMDLAVNCLGYNLAKGNLSKESYQERFLEVLRVRSTLGKAADRSAMFEQPVQPDLIHGTNRASIGSGVNDGRYFIDFGYRPVFSDLLDTEVMSGQGTQIEFANLRLRVYPEEDKVVVQELDVIDIVSISPRDTFFKPFSWKVRAGLSRRLRSDGDESTVFALNSGPGLAYYQDLLGLYYLFAEPELDLSGGLEQGYSLGMGMSAGILKQVTPRWKLHLAAKKTWFEYGEWQHPFEVSLTQHVTLSRNTAIGAHLGWTETSAESQGEVGLTWYVFF